MRKQLAAGLGTAALAAGMLLALPGTAAHASTIRPSAVNRCAQYDTWQTLNGGNYLADPNYGGRGTRVIVWPWTGGTEQHWCMERATEGGWYLHPGHKTNLCMDVPGSNYSDGVGLVIWDCNGRANQRFDITPVHIGVSTHVITPTANGSVRVTAGNGGDGNVVTISTDANQNTDYGQFWG
ncbi:hypothetical protein ABIA33_007004 [Streptacidiphilus sp. MAP12-16]|uniref:RICIN domain-containing protein n=1 Tax=Streptacidiphilus sp. MAP12-16 TaxID=3156300 RepID=UPI003513B29D